MAERKISMDVDTIIFFTPSNFYIKLYKQIFVFTNCVHLLWFYKHIVVNAYYFCFGFQ